jgi:hypothetical protein
MGFANALIRFSFVNLKRREGPYEPLCGKCPKIWVITRESSSSVHDCLAFSNITEIDEKYIGK